METIQIKVDNDPALITIFFLFVYYFRNLNLVV